MRSETARLLRAAAKKSGDWTRRRDDLIRQAKDEGASLREIADAAGLSHTGVKRVLDRC